MPHNRSRYYLIAVLLLILISLTACQKKASEEVVVYVSIDQVYAEPVLKAFEEQTGIHVLPVYDVEATKTTGLVNRLIAERDNPQADVFWSGEFAQTILLKNEQLLSVYQPESAADLPAQYRDPQGYWTAFAGRARILIVNTDLVDQADYPESIFDLVNPDYPAESVAIAYPLFGTTATHAAALYASLGPDQARTYFQQIQDRGVRVVDGNSVVRDLVASGQAAFGLTDTDDACRAIEDGYPVEIIFPDQQTEGLGTMITPNTVAMLAGAPHPQAARQLIDYLTSVEMEQMLVDNGWSQFPLRSVSAPPVCGGNASIKVMQVNLEDIYDQFERSKNDLTEIFLR